MAKLFSITFDAKTEEISEAYTAFQNKYTLRKKIIYTVVYLIVVVLGVDLIIKNPSSPMGFIATGLALGILLFNWIKPVLVKKRLLQTLSELCDETYVMSFYDDRLEVETIIDKNAETETVAITSTGIYTVEPGSEAEKELKENPPVEEEIQKSVYKLSETDVCFTEKNNIFMVFLNRSFIQTIPARCLSEEEQQQVRSYFEEKGLY
ncbi:MAG: hypothetical protein IJY73_09965 [Oscillospiraceae bacterium]|nr:hypothetical protein [Oscillospiraceae bacterium]